MMKTLFDSKGKKKEIIYLSEDLVLLEDALKSSIYSKLILNLDVCVPVKNLYK